VRRGQVVAADKLANPELYSVSVTLKPQAESVMPVAHGHHAHAFFLNLMKASDPSMAKEFHDSEGAKPFTLSPLRGKFTNTENQLALIPQARYRIGLTFLRGDAFAHFLDGALKWGNKTVKLGPAKFKIDGVDTINRRAPAMSFQRYQGILDSASASPQIELEFLSPTTFRSGGKNFIFPQPELVFGSYLNKWQAFSPMQLDDSLSAWFDKVMVARYRLQTHILDFGSYKEVGFTGKCRFELDKATPDEIAVALNVLADFALYCGTGAKTTMGMGQTRRLK
jgi:CRISPR-associated endoribonuclease Cas6